MLLFLLFSLAVGVHSTMDILVPAYFRSATEWTSMTNSSSQVGIVAILNPGSGPGTIGDVGDFYTKVNQLRAAGGKVVGYIYSSYTNRNISLVKADVDQYLAWYSLDGFFVDEMQNDGSSSSILYYQDLYNYIKAKNTQYVVIQNPGTTFPEVYVTSSTGDRFVSFENDQQWYAGTSTPSWHSSYPASTFIHLLYNANATQMTSAVDSAVTKRAGGIYVTDRTLSGNPWGGLPSYWSLEVSYVKTK